MRQRKKRREKPVLTARILNEHPDAKIRPCIRCQTDFVSTHIGNRMCPPCGSSGDVPGIRIRAFFGSRIPTASP